MLNEAGEHGKIKSAKHVNILPASISTFDLAHSTTLP